MDTVLHVTSADRFDQIADIVHDHWFDLESVQIDQERSVVTISFSTDSRPRSPVGFRMEIGGAAALSIEDSERVGRYDFNRVHYDKEQGQLVVETNIPLGLRIQVDRVDVTLRRTN